MSRNKSAARKRKLGKAIRQNRRMPLFVVAKTKRRVTQNRMRRDWRHEKMDLKED
jgi:large subunit ribosomal protein L39e